MDDRYDEWLTHVFEDACTTPRGWSSDDAEFRGSPVEIVGLTTRMLQRCGPDLRRFTDDQVAAGLRYVFDNSHSDLSFAIFDASVPLECRLVAIRSTSTLYTDCFAARCRRALAHRDDAAARNALNETCYMLWDVTPWSHWDERDAGVEVLETLVGVLSGVLESDHPACVESALHGLGHLHLGRAQALVEARIRSALPNIRDERLRAYALAAAAGCVA